MNEASDDLTGMAESALAAGDPEAALSIIANALNRQAATSRILNVAANSWVTLVDRGAPLDQWDPGKREMLLRILITQEGCSDGTPILHHRIAAQHSSGVDGHLEREALVLGPVLNGLLQTEQPHRRAVLMALMLRATMIGLDQRHLSMLHKEAFVSFSVKDLEIPYSNVFDRRNFQVNVEDLSNYVKDRGVGVLDGTLPLTHVMLLFWLVPATFDSLPSDWAARVLAHSPAAFRSTENASVARTLRLRFGLPPAPTDPIEMGERAEELIQVRRILSAESSTADQAAVSRVEQRPRMLIASVINQMRAAFPAVRSRRRPRIALCVSGQLRGFRRAWATWKPLLADVEATVFVDSWKSVGHGTPEPFRSTLPFDGRAFCAAYKKVGIAVGIDELRSRYPCLFAALDQGGMVNTEDLARLYRTPHVRLEDDGEAAYSAFTNSDKMYYKMQRCFEMTRDIEDFDMIVRMRPDKPVRLAAFDWHGLHEALRARPALYCETALGVHYGAILMGDQVAIGLPEAMRVYSETFSRSPGIAALAPYRMERQLWGHTSVAQLCWFVGIEVRKVPLKFGPFLEAEPLETNAIGEAVLRDSIDRMDSIDRTLLAAIARDRSCE